MLGFHGIGLPVPVFPPSSEIPWQNNGTWSASAPPFANTPTLGAELLTNGGFETWTTPTNAGTWTEGLAGTSTVNQETSVVNSGSNALRLDVDSSNSNVYIEQTLTHANHTWLQASVWAKAASGTPVFAFGSSGGASIGVIRTLSTAYQNFVRTERAASANLPRGLKRQTATSNSLYFDDLSIKPITLNTLFNVRVGAAMPASVIGAGTIALECLAGIVYGLDSIGTPTNCIIATHDGGTAIKLEKMVAGVWSTVLSTTATYVANVLPQIKWTGGTTFQLWYNGTQRGADQTISDAGTGTLHGAMSTSPLNTITAVTVS